MLSECLKLIHERLMIQRGKEEKMGNCPAGCKISDDCCGTSLPLKPYLKKKNVVFYYVGCRTATHLPLFFALNGLTMTLTSVWSR